MQAEKECKQRRSVGRERESREGLRVEKERVEKERGLKRSREREREYRDFFNLFGKGP